MKLTRPRLPRVENPGMLVAVACWLAGAVLAAVLVIQIARWPL